MPSKSEADKGQFVDAVKPALGVYNFWQENKTKNIINEYVHYCICLHKFLRISAERFTKNN